MWRGLDGVCPSVAMYGEEENGLIQWKWIGPFFMGEMGGRCGPFALRGKGDSCMWMVSRNRRHKWEAALMRGFSTVYCPGWGLKGNGACEAFPFLMFFERLCPRLCRCLRYNYLKLLNKIFVA